jgi:predicted chitinase
MTPAQFEANTAKAREVLACVMGDVVNEEYPNSGNSEAVTVRRAAAWWMTGDPNQYNRGDTAPYTQKALQYYQQQ